MSVSVNDILQVMEKIAPVDLAEEWDNVGLQIGQPDWPADTVGVALDPTPDVVKSACDQKLNLLITHHPLIFRPISTIDFGSTFGEIVKTAVRNRLSIVAAHTNYDSANGGLNDILARIIKLKNLMPLIQLPDVTKDVGIGRVGDISSPMKLSEFGLHLKKQLGLSGIRLTGDPDLTVNRVAICTGSGSSLMKEFYKSDAQVYVSGDMRYHDARDVEAAGRGMIDIGHFGSEHIMVDALSRQLTDCCAREGLKVKVTPLELETDPFMNL